VGKDILTQCKEAFAQGPQAYADSKSTPEMAQERYERVTSTFMMAVSYLSGISLLRISFLLAPLFLTLNFHLTCFCAETLSPEDNIAFAEQYKALFLDPVFWKFLSNKSITIRRAAYPTFIALNIQVTAKQIPFFYILYINLLAYINTYRYLC
jgi:hypothetical protein